MEKMRAAFKKEDDNLVVYGCSAHWLNLLGGDLTPDSTMKDIITIQKFFKNKHKPIAWLAEYKESVKPQLFGDTRWKSQLTCIDSYIHNRPYYVKISLDHEDEMDKDVSKLIMNTNLFKTARSLAERLRPIAFALDTCQSDSSSLADATNAWIKLSRTEVLQSKKQKVMHRMTQALTDEHYVAYALHPKYQGELLDTEERNIVHQWLVNKNPDFISTLLSFQTKRKPFLE